MCPNSPDHRHNYVTIILILQRNVKRFTLNSLVCCDDVTNCTNRLEHKGILAVRWTFAKCANMSRTKYFVQDAYVAADVCAAN